MPLRRERPPRGQAIGDFTSRAGLDQMSALGNSRSFGWVAAARSAMPWSCVSRKRRGTFKRPVGGGRYATSQGL